MTQADLVERPVRAVAAGEGVCVLLVDRDGFWRAGLSAYLTAEGFRVLIAARPLEADALLQTSPVDLVIIQALSAGGGGLDLCRQLSANDGAPVILVSDRAQELDRIIGLEVGADDFVDQACGHRELLARIRAVLRRRTRRRPPLAHGAPADGRDQAPVYFAGWTLSPGNLEVRSPDGRRSLLTPGDLKLLSALLDRPRETITRERLGRLLGRPDPNLRCLDTGVSRLRRKLGATPGGEPIIRTVHGVGYMLDCLVERDGVGAEPEDSGRQAVG